MKKLRLLFFSMCFVPMLVFGQNVLSNPGFEDGVDSKGIPNGWIGFAQAGASLQVVNDATKAHSGNYWVKCTSTQGGYYLLYQNSFPSKQGDTWRLSSFIKDISPTFPGGYYVALKISAKSVTGATFQSWEIFQDSITSNWKKFFNTQTMPNGTAFVQAVLVIHAADGAPEATYALDDVKFELTNNVDKDNLLANYGFEEGLDSKGIPNGWIGYAQTGASIKLIDDYTTSYAGDYWVKCTSTQGGYYLLYQNTFPAKESEIWKFSSFIKDISPANPGGVFAALKISAKSSTGATFKSWEVYQDSVTSKWKEFANIQTMPAGTAFIQAVIVVHAADGAPEASYGFDNVKLKKIYVHTSSTLPNYLTNPGFEEGVDSKGIPNGWIGYAQTGASINVIKENATAYNGDYWTKCTSTQGGYYLLYQKTYATKEGDVWDFSSFIKDVSPKYPGASYVALKISAKSVTGATFLAWEIFQDSVKNYWKKFTNRQTMPAGTAFIQAVIVVHGADGAPEASYGFDDVRLELVSSVPDKTNLLANPGFEEGVDDKGIPKGWIGYAQTGASLVVKSDLSTAHSGANWVKCTSTLGGYYLLYQNSFPAKPGQIWELSSYLKDISPSYPGANFAALKISAKSVTGSTFQYWEIYPDKVTTDWVKYSNTQTMPDGTAYIQAVVVIHAADGAPEASYGIDDVNLTLIKDVGIEQLNTSIPIKYELSQNYPNPFNPETTIQYSLPKEGNVTLKVYSIIGQEVASLVDAHQKIGNYKVNFKAEHLASGIYFYRIQSGSFYEVRKMMLVK